MFRVHKGSWELPDPQLLNIHACIGNFLHMSGQAEVIDDIMDDFENCGLLAPSGSTNIEDLVAVRGLPILGPRKLVKINPGRTLTASVPLQIGSSIANFVR
jgi:hypothetical protein